MHYRLFTSAAAALLLTCMGAGAQTPSSPPAMPSTGAGSATSQSAQGTQNADRLRAMSQDRLRQVLSQAGFQEVEILDAAYLVSAKTKEGDSVMMILNPPSMDVTGSTTMGTSGSAGTGSTPNTPSAPAQQQ